MNATIRHDTSSRGGGLWPDSRIPPKLSSILSIDKRLFLGNNSPLLRQRASWIWSLKPVVLGNYKVVCCNLFSFQEDFLARYRGSLGLRWIKELRNTKRKRRISPGKKEEKPNPNSASTNPHLVHASSISKTSVYTYLPCLLSSLFRISSSLLPITPLSPSIFIHTRVFVPASLIFDVINFT